MKDLEHELLRQGLLSIAGSDESGRGALAGPIVASAITFYSQGKPLKVRGIKDSKLLSHTKRRSLSTELISLGADHHIAVISHEVIDRKGIQAANYDAIRDSVEGLIYEPDIVLIDGYRVPIAKVRSLRVVGGDKLCRSIAAASILAKVYRDELMEELDDLYPEYGFRDHKGYGTKKHLAALKRYGPSPVHRISYRPISETPKAGTTKV